MRKSAPCPPAPACISTKTPRARSSTSARRRTSASRVRSYFLEASQANAKTGSLMREAVDVDYITRRQRARGARARKQSHQAAQAALQHPAARRQDLSLRQAHARRPLPQGVRHPPSAQGRQRLLRPLLSRKPRLPHRRLIHRSFLIPSCKVDLSRYHPRACLQYYIKRCLGPCVEGLTTPEIYREAVRDVQLFLEGKPPNWRSR